MYFYHSGDYFRYRRGCNPPNRVIDISIEEDEGVEEPVTLEEVKQHLNITFTDNDSFLARLIIRCRAALEKYTGLSLVEKSIELHCDNYEGDFELPYGPVLGDPYITNSEDVEYDTATFSGIKFKKITTPRTGGLRLTYDTGYDIIPADLRMALLEEIAYRFENRGDTERADIGQMAKGLAKAWRRVPVIM
jgi:hypothetical protein